MITLPYDDCFGCGGCYNICPKQAITMTPDKYGYVHPVIDEQKCIECHMCENVCTVHHPQPLHQPINVWAAVAKKNDLFQTVASGGLCSVMTEYFLSGGGVVYGCGELNYRDIRHIRIDKLEDAGLLKNSKYVHSDMNDAMKSVKKDLIDGRKVLFIGTPCQISGLYGYLHKNYDNLTTIDLVCHGVPSQQMLRDQIEMYRKSDIQDFENGFVQFRWKTRYGIRFGIRFGIRENLIKEELSDQNAYMSAFLSGISYRENCYSCPFATSERVSDITAADFWGLGNKTWAADKMIPSRFIDDNGVSLVIINTIKGKAMFEAVENRFELEEHTIEEATLNNCNLSHPSPCLPTRQKFLHTYVTKGIRAAAKASIPNYRRNTNPILRAIKSSKAARSIYRALKNLNQR